MNTIPAMAPHDAFVAIYRGSNRKHGAYVALIP
jgi:hypothetical protein